MASKRYLYVSYLRLNDSTYYKAPIYCYACSPCHAMNLAIKFAVENLGFTLNTFSVSDPILISNFTR